MAVQNPTIAEATMQFRRLLRRNGEQVLQQMWSVKTFDAETCACIGVLGEWRDVPAEHEE